MDNQRLANRRRRRRIRRLQRMIPGAIAILLIAIIIFVGIKTGLFESFAYTTERADLYSYFGAISDNSAVRIVNGEITSDQIQVIDGFMYIPLTRVKEEFNNRFYLDENDRTLLYPTAVEVISAPLGASSYTKGGTSVSTPYVPCLEEDGEVMVALDYVQQFANFTYELYGGSGEPYRCRLDTEGGTDTAVKIKKAQSVRVDMDKKAKVLVDLKEGDQVVVLEEGKDWTKVQTEDLIIGYYETRFLDESFSVSREGPTPYSEPEFTCIHKDTPIRLIWDNVTTEAANAGLKDRLKGSEGITTVSPTWFYLINNDGDITSIATHDYVTAAHDLGLEVWGLVENMTYNDELKMKQILSFSQKRAYLISQLMQYAAEYELDGINVDFEALPSDAGSDFAEFIFELSIACRQAGLVLSVDNYVSTAATSHYHRDLQGTCVDYVIIMGYDEHYNGSEEDGSVASLNFVIDGITKTMEEVPTDKIINAVPLYTRIWTETPKSASDAEKEDPNSKYIPYTLKVETLSMGEALEYVANAGVEAKWDEETQQHYAEWDKGERTVKVWLEDEDSLTAKIQSMHSFNLPGIAAWQLRFANDMAWRALAKF